MFVRPEVPGGAVVRDIAGLYLAALIYVAFDLVLFRMLSASLTMVLELVELAPIGFGAWLYWQARDRKSGRRSSFPRLLYVPVISTSVQLQILLMACLYRHVALA